MEHGLKDIVFYVKKHAAYRAVSYNLPLVRNKQLGKPAFVRHIYHIIVNFLQNTHERLCMPYYMGVLVNFWYGP